MIEVSEILNGCVPCKVCAGTEGEVLECPFCLKVRLVEVYKAWQEQKASLAFDYARKAFLLLTRCAGSGCQVCKSAIVVKGEKADEPEKDDLA